MTLIVNGETKEFKDDLTLKNIITELYSMILLDLDYWEKMEREH